MESYKKYSPALYILIIFCFLLPFLNLSCGGQRVMSLTGLQIVMGTEYEQQSAFGGNSKTTKIKAEPLAILAFIVAIAGLLISLIKIKKISLISVILSSAGAVFLYLLKNKLDNDVITQGQGMISIEYEFGYWFALLIFVGGAIIQGLIYNQEKKTNSVQVDNPNQHND